MAPCFQSTPSRRSALSSASRSSSVLAIGGAYRWRRPRRYRRRVICVLAGGVGAARMLAGLVQVVPPADITVVGNVGDDLVLHGLHISPDLDTITYTLADQVDPDRGWGLRDETWQAMDMVGRYGGVDWFNLGDRDLGTHLYRTHRLSEGAS